MQMFRLLAIWTTVFALIFAAGRAAAESAPDDIVIHITAASFIPRNYIVIHSFTVPDGDVIVVENIIFVGLAGLLYRSDYQNDLLAQVSSITTYIIRFLESEYPNHTVRLDYSPTALRVLRIPIT